MFNNIYTFLRKFIDKMRIYTAIAYLFLSTFFKRFWMNSPTNITTDSLGQIIFSSSSYPQPFHKSKNLFAEVFFKFLNLLPVNSFSFFSRKDVCCILKKFLFPQLNDSWLNSMLFCHFLDRDLIIQMFSM